MKTKIASKIKESIEIKKIILNEHVDIIAHISETILKSLKAGKKILICGNGGSASDAQHIAGEFINRFYLNRKPYPAIALTSDTAVITSIANDFSYDEIFKKQVEALGEKDDILIAISTSGNSKNVNLAIKAAQEKKMLTIGFTGEKGGELKKLAEITFQAPSNDTPRIQEAHILTFHIICELVEERLACNTK